jgi:hypothetical protein
MSEQSADFQTLINDLNQLVDDLRSSVTHYTPPPFTPKALLLLLRDNLHKLSPDVRRAVVAEIEKNLENTKPQAFLDPDLWRGLWHVFQQQIASQSAPLLDPLRHRLSALPGAGFVSEVASSFEGAKPSDFLDPETWKGLWFLVNYQVQAQGEQLRERLRGSAAETTDDDAE